MELYYVIAITDRDDAETLNGIYKQTGIPLVLTKLGMGTAQSEHLSIYGLDATQKAVVSAIATRPTATRRTAIFSDILFFMTLRPLLSRSGNSPLYARCAPGFPRRPISGEVYARAYPAYGSRRKTRCPKLLS